MYEKMLEKCTTVEDILIVVLREIKMQNDAASTEQEFCINVCTLMREADKRRIEIDRKA